MSISDIEAAAQPASAIMPLLGAVDAIPGECLMSLMARAASRNIFQRVRGMVATTGIDVLQPSFIPFTGRVPSSHLSHLLGIKTSDIDNRMHPALDPERPFDRIRWYGTTLPRKFISVDRRFSPKSFAKSGYIRAIWQVRPITFCPESMEMLVSKCQHCGAVAGWRLRHGFHQCETCGRSLRNGRPGKVEWALREHARAATELVSPFDDVRKDALRKLPDIFSDWEPGEVFVSVVELGLAFSFPDRKEHTIMSKRCAAGDFSGFNVEHLVAGYRATMDWPASLHTYLPSVIGGGKRDIHHRLGPFGKYFLSTRNYGKPINDVIRAEIKKTLTENDLIPFGGNLHRTDWMKRPDRLTRNESGKHFGIEPKIVGRLSGCGQSVALVGAKKGQVLYDPAKLGPSVAIYKSGVSAHAAAKRIGVYVFCIPTLARRGLIKAVTDHDALIMAGGPLYDRQSVDAFCLAARKSVQVTNGGRLLSTCMERIFHPEAWGDVIERILGGDIPVCFSSSEELGPFAEIRVDQDSVDRVIAALPSRAMPEDTEVPSVVAGALLGIPGDVVAQLIKLRLLDGAFRKRVGCIGMVALSEFSRKYILGREGDLVFGKGGFARRLEAARVQPVAQVKRFRVWLRSDTVSVLASS